MLRYDIINALLKKCQGTSYLEIGVQGRWKCYDKVTALHKIGVDPDPKAQADFVGTSDEFFKQNKEKFDVIFIDGLHEDWQFEKDILNSLKFISMDGYIVCHDCNPKLETEQQVPRISKRWNGNCWRAWVALKRKLANEMFVIDTDEGVGVICLNLMSKQLKSSSDKVKMIDLKYSDLEKNRKDWLGLITVEQFQEWL